MVAYTIVVVFGFLLSNICSSPLLKLRFKHYRESLENTRTDFNPATTLTPPTSCDVSSCKDNEGLFPFPDKTYEFSEQYFLHCTNNTETSACKQCAAGQFFNPNCKVCTVFERRQSTDCPTTRPQTTKTVEPAVCSADVKKQCNTEGPTFNGTLTDPTDKTKFASCSMGLFVGCQWCQNAFGIDGKLVRLQHNNTVQACLFDGDKIHQDQYVQMAVQIP